jgi:class 3 adenylate cyclase
VNVAQRLEGLTKTLGHPLILSEGVRELLPEGTETVFLDEVTVRGREQPLRIYALGGVEDLKPKPEYPVAKGPGE